ncbi:MAG: DHA2 family efflux MFS transporter permease subunit [Rhodococcus sp. (in: high G+C Gram-positive bacteria)]
MTLSAAGRSTTRARPGLVLFVLSLAAFMASLDVFIVNVAFDDIGKDFQGTTISELSWILNAYTIVYAALLVPAGRLADRFGRKGSFLFGLAVFTAASLACALSEGIWWLTAFRAVQAIGAAILTPASLGLVIAATAPDNRARAVRIWAATGALAAALGPAMGGVLVELSWRWVFIVNIPIGVLAFVAAALVVERSRDDAVSAFPDVLGAVLLALSIGALTLGLVEGPEWGWTDARITSAWVVTVVALIGFVVSSSRHRSPVIDAALLRVRAFSMANVVSLLFAIPFAGSLLVNILWMQQVWGYSAIKTGFAVVPGPLMVPLFTVLAHLLAQRRVPVGVIVAAGCVLMGISGFMVAAQVGAQPDYASSILPSLLLGGAGVGFALPTILSSATADLPQSQSATGSAVVNMSRQIGTALGVSLIVAILGTPVGYEAAHTVFQHAWWALAGVAFLAALAAPGMTPARSSGMLSTAEADPEADVSSVGHRS